MQLSDLKLDEKGGSWTNDTGAPVELNPPGIVVAPGARIEVAENGSVKLLDPPEKDETAKVAPASPAAPTPKKDAPKTP
jgi:hypothetical protein